MTREQLEAIAKETKLNSVIQLCKELKDKIENEKDDDDLKVDSPTYSYLQGQEDILDIIINFIDK